MNFISVEDAAVLWGVSPRSVRNYCAQGRVAGAHFVGKTWRIPADAAKPSRANARPTAVNPLLERLRAEKAAGIRGGIYHKAQVELAYNSNHIEGSRLTLDQTRLIFETSTIGATGGTAVRVDDVVEAANHFRALDYIIDSAASPLTERMLKRLHLILKSGTSDSHAEWFAVGDYKRLPNEVGGRQTTAPEEVPSAIHRLLDDYGPRKRHALEEIVAFHVALERIHPFQDGNGRVGRLVMFKECLAGGVVPFIIGDDMKAFYYRGISEWDNERGYLLDTCRAAQDRFAASMEYFRIER
ncbi:MAG: Fic family protein [Coriobacteriales bacterium]|jgi:Fic family protein